MCHFLEIIEDTEKNRKYKNELSAEVIQQVIDSLPRQAAVTFTGGEALMKKDFLAIFDYAASRNKVHIITNGTVLSNSLVEHLLEKRLKRFWGPGFFFLGVSMEGREEFHDHCTQVPGSFLRTTEGLEHFIEKRSRLSQRYPMIHLTCVISRHNVNDLEYLYDYAIELGVDVYNLVLSNPATYWHGKDYEQADQLFKPAKPVETIDPKELIEVLESLQAKSKSCSTPLRFSPNGITQDEIVRYYSNQSDYRNYKCHSPWAKVGVSAYGDVFSCPHYRLGNIQDSGNGIDWNSKSHGEFRKRLKDERIFPGCLGCCQSEYIG